MYRWGLTANGAHIRTIDPLHGGDIAALNIPEDDNPTLPNALPINIVYEDDHIAVINNSLGMPLAGDDMYGGSRELITRQALHCGQLNFRHPATGHPMEFQIPLPEDMARLTALKE